MLTEGAADDQDARSEAVIALIQTELFESIVQLQEAEDGEVDPKERVALLSKVAKNVATLSRASVNLKKFQSEVRARAQQAASNAEKIARKGDCQATQYRRFVARFWGLPHDKIIRVILNAAGGGPEGMSPMDGGITLLPFCLIPRRWMPLPFCCLTSSAGWQTPLRLR